MDGKNCSNCDIFKSYNDFYDKDSKCIKCRSIINKQKRSNNRKTLIDFQDKMEKLQGLNNMLIEENIKKDKIITELYEEIKELKNKHKRNGIIY